MAIYYKPRLSSTKQLAVQESTKLRQSDDRNKGVKGGGVLGVVHRPYELLEPLSLKTLS